MASHSPNSKTRRGSKDVEVIQIVYSGYVMYQERQHSNELARLELLFGIASISRHYPAKASRRSSRIGRSYIGEPRPSRTIDQSPSLRCQRYQNRDKRFVRHPDPTISLICLTWERTSYDGIITTNGARARRQRVCSAKNICKYVRILSDEENSHRLNQHTATGLY